MILALRNYSFRQSTHPFGFLVGIPIFYISMSVIWKWISSFPGKRLIIVLNEPDILKMCSAVEKSPKEGGESAVIPVEGLFSLTCTFFTVSNGLFPLFQHVRRLSLKLELGHPATWGTPWGAFSTNTDALVFRNEVSESSLWKYVHRTRKKDMHVCVIIHVKPSA